MYIELLYSDKLIFLKRIDSTVSVLKGQRIFAFEVTNSTSGRLR
jgi:hypothetical protein